jgi:hypothetical protein
MATFILLLAFLLACSALFFENAGYIAVYGFRWAAAACYAVQLVCQRPELAMYAAAGLAGMWAVVKTSSIMRS